MPWSVGVKRAILYGLVLACCAASPAAGEAVADDTALLVSSETKRPFQRLQRGLDAHPPPPNRGGVRRGGRNWGRGSAAGASGPRWQDVDSCLEECSGGPEPR